MRDYVFRGAASELLKVSLTLRVNEQYSPCPVGGMIPGREVSDGAVWASYTCELTLARPSVGAVGCLLVLVVGFRQHLLSSTQS